MVRHPIRSSLILAALLLPVCAFASLEDPVDPAAQAKTEEPTPEVIVEAPEPRFAVPTLRDRIGRIWAPVIIDGKGPFRLVLDTGANRSAVTQQLVNSLGPSVRDAPQIIVHGVTGSATVPAIRVDEMVFGELLVKTSILPVVPDVFGGADGVLGKEGFEDKRILVDFGKDRLVISRSHLERAPWGFATVPITIQRDGLLVATVRIGTVKVRAVIDTGGQQTTGNIALRDALIRHASKKDETSVIEGVTLDRQNGQTIRIPPINFGTVEIRNMSLMLGDIHMFRQWRMTSEPALLIGMDVLGSVDTLIIDYKMRQLQIRLRRPPPGAEAAAIGGGIRY